MWNSKALSAFLLLVSPLPAVSSAKCAFAADLTSIGNAIDLVDSKLSIVGFEASINYVSLPADATPFVTVVAASEEPLFSSENGIFTISSSSCDSGLEAIGQEDPEDNTTAVLQSKPEETVDETEAETVEVASSTFLPSARTSTMLSGFLTSALAPRPYRGMGMLLVAACLMGSLAPVNAAGHESVESGCKPSLELEISLPMGAEVGSTFGETDHYLAATTDTVTWGYYDPNATAKATMESGETITVEVVTHHAGHDYAKMIRGDPAVEEIFYWEINSTLKEKPEPKLAGSGVHLITGPIEVVGADIGDVVEVVILELDPRNNPATGRCFGTNSQKFAGYQYNALTGEKRDGTPYVRTGGTEAITVFEFVEDDAGKMMWGKPMYMYRFPNMTAPDGSIRTFDNNPAVTIPHEFDHGYEGGLLDETPLAYPEGFDGTRVTDEDGIVYLSPEIAALNWKVPLRPHLGTLAVMPNNTANYIDEDAPGGANSIPPSRFGGNVDDWRIGKGGTMFYTVEVPGAMILVGDTHAAQGDSELAGTAMETSMTTKLRVILHKKSELPAKVKDLTFPLLETDDQFVIHGFAYANYLDELENPSNIFAEGASLDLAMADCFIKTRNWLMNVMGLIEEETIALMTTAVDFGITQVVDGNWGVHADIDKWVFDETDTPYDYSCTTSKSGRRASRRSSRKLAFHYDHERRLLLKQHGMASTSSPEEYAADLYARVTTECAACATHMERSRFADILLDTKLHFAKKHLKYYAASLDPTIY